ncbi:hypothetical protein BX600DRAFT_466618 [Xylariales sp. PMI_506]|nr:hypothetical protein BX600DRAFT_466618 [Xylariales sp. PMI_506]
MCERQLAIGSNVIRMAPFDCDLYLYYIATMAPPPPGSHHFLFPFPFTSNPPLVGAECNLIALPVSN